MDPATRLPPVCGRLGKAALAVALIAAGGRAWGQVPSATAATAGRAVVPPARAAPSPLTGPADTSPPSPPAGTLERAALLLKNRSFEQAATMLRRLLSVDPANRRAKEMLAFDLESMGDLKGELEVRSALAAELPNDPRIQTDYGRVLERSGDVGGALRAYRRARALSAGRPPPELDAAIERMSGRTALEVGTPVAVMSDPEAIASSVQAGAAVPFGSRRHLTLLGTRNVADGRTNPGRTTSDALALTLVLQNKAGTSFAAGPRLHMVSPRGGARRDLGIGGAIAGRAPFGRSLEAEWRAEVETPWDEAAVTVLRGGRTTAAEGHLYSHSFSRRLLLQAGARRRQVSILSADPRSTSRPKAWQSLWLAGADIVLWSKPGASVRGEMLDEALIEPTTLASALALAYRHYDVSSRPTPEFASLIGLAPRGSVDEGSVATTLVSPRGNLGLELRAGLARDSEREARVWRAGGGLIWAPKPATRFALRYEEANEVASGLVGQRRTGWLSFHVDL